MRYIFLAFSWIIGLFFLITGVISLLTTPLPALLAIAIACLILPPVAKFIYAKMNRHPTKLQHNLIILVLFLFMGAASQLNSSTQTSQPSIQTTP